MGPPIVGRWGAELQKAFRRRPTMTVGVVLGAALVLVLAAVAITLANDDGRRWDLFKTLLPILFTALLTLIIGGAGVLFWNTRQKINESDLAARAQFYDLYGELISLFRLWHTNKSFHSGSATDWKARDFPTTVRWDLLQRATAVDGNVEALIVKITSERNLSERDIMILGLFREAAQSVREAIRDGKPGPWISAETPSYKALKFLASNVGYLLAGEHPWFRPLASASINSLLLITRSSTQTGMRRDWKDDWDKLNGNNAEQEYQSLIRSLGSKRP